MQCSSSKQSCRCMCRMVEQSDVLGGFVSRGRRVVSNLALVLDTTSVWSMSVVSPNAVLDALTRILSLQLSTYPPR